MAATSENQCSGRDGKIGCRLTSAVVGHVEEIKKRSS
jgi:hypothetical protein